VASGRDVLDIPIAPGMRQDVDSALLPVGVPRYLQNVRCYQQGRLDKRPGTLPLGTGALPDGASSTWLSQQGERAVLGVQEADAGDRLTNRIYAQESPDDDASWAGIGNHGGVVPLRRFSVSPQSTRSAKNLASARVGSLLYVAYSEVGGGLDWVNIHVVTPDGAVLRAVALQDADNARLLHVNGVLYLFYRATNSTGADNIVASVVNQTDLSLGAPFTMLTVGGNDFDVAPLEGTTDFLLAAADGSAVGVFRLSAPDTTVANVTITTSAAASCVGIAGYASGHVLVGWVEGGSTGDVKVAFRNPTTLASVITHTVDSATGNEVLRYQLSFTRRTATEWVVAYGGEDSPSVGPALPFAYFSFAVVTSASDGSPRKTRCFGLASKPFLMGSADGESAVYVWGHSQGDATKWRTQAAHYLIELNTASGATSAASWSRLAAISYEHVATYGASTSFMAQLPTVESFGAGLFAAPLNWADPTLTGIDVAVFAAATRADSVAASTRFVAEKSGALVVSGGCLYEHTGGTTPSSQIYVTENGFAYDPELVTGLLSGGSLTADQEYTYRAVYRWTDALGRVHLSAPSSPVTATPTGGNLTVAIAAPHLSVTGRHGVVVSDVEVEFYRSWLGGPYYLCGSLSLRALSEPVFNDDSADSVVEVNRVLYTDLGILPTDPPSGARLWCDGGTRVFAVGWRENVVQFSKLLIPTAPIEFVDDDAFRIFVREPITAIHYLDGALVIFCKGSKAYLVTGDGPSDQGVGQYSEPRPLPVTASCDDARSLLEVAQGLLFKGGGTIWLMPRGFAPPIPIGDAIATRLEAYPYVLAAVLTHKSGSEGTARCAHFVLAPGDTDADGAPLVAVYDLELGSWSIDTIGGPGIGAATAIGGEFSWVSGTWATASSANPVRRFDAGEFQDYDADGGALWIETRVELGYVRPFGLLGWGRVPKVQLFGYVPGACRLTLSGTLNDAPFAEATKEFVSVPLFTSYLEHAFESSPCNSLQFNLTDSVGDPEAPAYTAGYSIRGLAIELQPEKGLRRVKTDGTERF
jgi:hypothetical protein